MQQANELTGLRRIPRTEYAPSRDVRSNAVRDRTGAAPARVLVVEDEAAYGRCLLRTIERCGGAATLVGTAHDASEKLTSDVSWNGLIVDVGLPDGSGLDILSQARAKAMHVPALIITGLRDNHVASAAFGLKATYLVKPVEDVYVESLVRYALEDAASRAGTRLQPVLTRWMAQYGLSQAETDIILLGSQGCDRASIASIRGTTEATIRNQIHSLLQKTGDPGLREAAMRLLQEALNY